MKLCGKMDSIAAWVTAKGKVTLEQDVVPPIRFDGDGAEAHGSSSDAGPSTVEVELTGLEAVTTIYRLELLLAQGGRAADDAELKAAVESIAKSGTGKRKADEMACMAEPTLLPRLGREGRVTNTKELLANVGVRLGSTVQAKSASTYCKALQKGSIVELGGEKVLVRFDHGAVATWTLADFPVDDFLVIALPDDGNIQKEIEVVDVHAKRLAASSRWGVSTRKAELVLALDQMATALEEVGFCIDDYVTVDCRRINYGN